MYVVYVMCDCFISFCLFVLYLLLFFFFFNDTAPTEIYTLSLHDALPISLWVCSVAELSTASGPIARRRSHWRRSEEHTSELQSHVNLVCRLLLEKKKKKIKNIYQRTTMHIHHSQITDLSHPAYEQHLEHH